MANMTNRVTVGKTFNIPKFSLKQETANFPGKFRTSQTYRFDMVTKTENGEPGCPTQVTGTIADVFVVNDPEGNPYDVLVTLSPVWYYDGPDYHPMQINLSEVVSLDQMYISLIQDKARPTLSANTTQYHFIINNHPVDSDDEHFLKVVIRKDDIDPDDTLKNTTSIYGRISSVYYSEATQTQIIVLNAMEMVDGRVSYYRADVDVAEIIGIYRYRVECKKLTRRPRQDEDGDVLPEPVEMPAGKKSKKTQATETANEEAAAE